MKSTARKHVWMFVLALGASASAVPAASAKEQARSKATAAKIKRGEYLVSTGACHDCHTPHKLGPNGPEPDMSRMLSGHPAQLVLPPSPKLPPGPWVGTIAATMTAWSGPWGTSFVANITPHDETGIGKWTEQNFVETIRTGRHLGRGRPLLPPMPWPVYRNFTDADLAAIFAYLQSIPPIDNRVPDPIAPPDPKADAKAEAKLGAKGALGQR